MRSNLAVAIVNHNTREHLRRCLETVMEEAPAEVVVVDNASTDGSPEMVRAEFPDVIIIARDDNPGYGIASNQAVLACKTPYVLLLNSDTRLTSGGRGALEAYLDKHPQAAIVAPRLINEDGSLQPSCFPKPSSLVAFIEETGLSQLVGRLPVVRERYERTWSHDRPRQIPWVLGAALAMRREAFKEVGGFDASFFMYFEETDLCFRMREAGWEVHFAPVAELMHLGGASTSQQPTAMAAQLYASMFRFHRKHYGPTSAWLIRALIRTAMALRLGRDRVYLCFVREAGRREQLAGAIERSRAVLDVR